MQQFSWIIQRRRLLTSVLWMSSLLVLLIVGSDVIWAQEPTPVVEPARVDGLSWRLARDLAATDGPVSFLVILKDQLDLDEVSALSAKSAEQAVDANALYSGLTAHASATQADIRSFLETRDAPFRPYYIVNMLAVEGDAQLAVDLLARDDVDRLEANPEIPQSIFSGQAAVPDYGWARVVRFPAVQATLDIPYGLRYTHADDVWEMGYTGQDIVVASQDTGVDWTHPALQPLYRGWDSDSAAADHVYNWFDAWGVAGRPTRCDSDPQIPCDDYGHGTHTVGTMLGNAQGTEPRIGMAPDAEWIGCRNMRNGFGAPGAYAACFEFFLAPYPQDGDPFVDGLPEKAPHIINNSWGCPPNEGCDADTLQQVVETMRVAGQFVISSAGNHGYDGCATVEDPIAIYDAVFSIGAHDSGGALAGFSSRGPVAVDGSGRMKPDIAAPGVAVYSSWVNNGYQVAQGTSMASPHVAGAAALLWSAVPDLMGEIDLSEQVLIKSATSVLTADCNADGQESTPNQLFGYGQLNVLKAVEMALNPATVTITVTHAGGLPLVDATVVLVDNVTGYRYFGRVNAAGVAIFSPIYVGSYAVRLLTSDGAETSSELTAVDVAFEDENVAVEVGLSETVYMPIIVR